MRFNKWIKKQGGPRAVAQLLGTESPTVRAWMRKSATPRAVVMQQLVKMGKGAFSYEDIISETKPKQGVRS
jgi:hypothetical protein